jgi:WD40 repeat protein
VEVAADGRFVAAIQRRPPGQILELPLDGSSAVVHGPPELSECVINGVTIAPEADRVAFECFTPDRPEAIWIGILDLKTDEVRRVPVEGTSEACAPGPFQDLAWLPDGRLFSDGTLGLRVWDLDDGSSTQPRPCRVTNSMVIGTTPDSGTVLTLYDPRPPPGKASTLSAFDTATGVSREIAGHGNRVSAFAVDSTSTVLVTGDADGLVRVGPLSGGEPHLLFGHSRAVTGAAVSPDGKWIATASADDTIRLWPMPDMTKSPHHTQPRAELLAKLRSLTNLRAVSDPESTTGYALEPGPLPTWESLPSW